MPTLPFGLEQSCLPLVQFFAQFWYFIVALGIPLPIGVIGAWRWGIWLFRRVIGMWYRPMEPNGYTATTTIITPVYNEDPELFRAALRSWAANRPSEIVAVIDHTDKRCMEQFREFEEEVAGTPLRLKMLITHTPGKRPALADGILAASGDVVFLVDSDTIWDLDLIPKALAPFIEPEVGGVTMRQRVWQPHSTAQRIFDVYLDIRYIDEIRYLTAFGDAVTCLSGRTAVYRRFVALTALEDLMEETFWGRKVISGDDKALTLAVQKRGWKVRYQENACVYTPGATVMKVFLKQRLRWARNSWRADLKALGSQWAWRKPFLAFHLTDRMLQPLTTLVAPLYLGFLLVHGQWPAIGILLSWWFVSRTIKIMPHLRSSWKNIRVLPWYVFFNYWSAVMKIYAFFTMNQQGWITRWSRSGKASAWAMWMQTMPSYTATAVTVALVAIFINSIHQIPVRAATTIKETPEEQPIAQAGNDMHLGGTTVSFDSAEWQQFWAPPTVNQCKSAPIVSQSGRASKPVEVIEPMIVQSITPPALTTITGEANQLCILTGGARGTCSSAGFVTPAALWEATVGGESSVLPQWLALNRRWVAVTGTDEAAQFCFFSDPTAPQCTGYSVAVPPSWHKWWQNSRMPTTIQHLQEQLYPLNGQSQTHKPVQATPEQQLCVMAGANEGACQHYSLR